ncbi:3-deoxy-D-manno-octulosonic acid transferase [Phenylobacterium montanum]|uniref:3-deoxy-D-manno-octulosonic acid transferase n=1 Tax=Phenylobacterium montanum TaxID=2823693 RepID=UPI0020125557|nr:glycosyltransferase N-terminal domain-containing protein [Caulobacter sp. S6]
MSQGGPLPLALYAGLTGLIEPLAPRLLQGRARRGKEDPARLGERLGRASVARPPGPLAWLHGASVGESLSLLPLVEAFRTRRPDATVLVTSGTRTSAELLARRLPAGAIHHYAPIDGPAAVARFLDHWRPDLAVRVESELWPNLLLETKRRGARMALLSAKLSEDSARSWSRLPRSARALFGAFDLVLAQDATAAARLERLGAKVAGLADLKFGAEALPVDPAALDALRTEIGGRPLILAASTHPGEDELVLGAFAEIAAPEALLVIVPRHPERGPQIAALAEARLGAVSLRSAGQGLNAVSVHVADTLGELGLWFRLARLAVIGGGFVSGVGGHNPLEPARLDCPFVSGGQVENWATAYAELIAVDGCALIEASELGAVMSAALPGDPALAARAGRAWAYAQARDVEARAALGRVVELLP